ncbi:YdeI/OmpD-associated family protein [Streptomyces sp. B6B3]|uniref:YdeI/OmpD-associated family protein n=1 Tax=Streptomyces sp. B6B3 TaxID=3153570 RepID=UPI00325CD939
MASARPGPDDPELDLADQDAWAAWLEDHHADPSGAWLRIAKKDSGLTSVGYAEAVETALCFGWIDGQSRRLDDRYWLQRFTPRRPRSRWSRINRQKAEDLIERGLMRPAGLAEVERARADGRWEAAYDSPRTAEVPDDLRAALAANPRAEAFFATLNGRNRYAILHRVQEAKRPETRTRRIATFVTMLADHRTPHP